MVIRLTEFVYSIFESNSLLLFYVFDVVRVHTLLAFVCIGLLLNSETKTVSEYQLSHT